MSLPVSATADLSSPRHSSHYLKTKSEQDDDGNAGLRDKPTFPAISMPCWQRRDSVDSTSTVNTHGATSTATTATITNNESLNSLTAPSLGGARNALGESFLSSIDSSANTNADGSARTVNGETSRRPATMLPPPSVDDEEESNHAAVDGQQQQQRQPAMYGVIHTAATPKTLPSPRQDFRAKYRAAVCTDITSESLNGNTSPSTSTNNDNTTISSKSTSEATPKRSALPCDTRTTPRCIVIRGKAEKACSSPTFAAPTTSSKHRDAAAPNLVVKSVPAAIAVAPPPPTKRRAVMGNAVPAAAPLRITATTTTAEEERAAALLPQMASAGALPSPLSPFTYVASRSVLHGFVERWRNKYEENKACYKEGGYLNVIPGKLIHARYVMIQKLGWGEFSTVWLAYDTKHATLGRGPSQAFVAVKIAKCHASVRESSLYEIGLLQYMNARLTAVSPVTNLVDSFEVAGDYGNHLCVVMPVHGSNLLAIIDQLKAKKALRGEEECLLIKECLLSTLTGLKELHAVNIIHTDIKPENVLCNSPDPRVLSSMETFCEKNSHRSNVISPEVLREHMFGIQPANNTHHQDDADLTDCATPSTTSASSSSTSSSVSATSSQQRHLVCLADFGLSAVLEPATVGVEAPRPASPSSSSPSSSLEKRRTTDAALRRNPNLRHLLSQLVTSKKEFPVVTAGTVRNKGGVLIQTREYRAPEVLLGLDFSTETDIWSVGCMAFEMITGEFLMDPKKRFMGQPRTPTLERQIDIEHLAMMQQLLGPLPESITSLRTRFNAYYEERKTNPRCSVSKYADANAAVRRPPVYIHRYIDEKGRFMYADYYANLGLPARRNLAEELKPFLGEAEARVAADFILQCLRSYDPTERPSAEELLRHPWLQGVGTPCLLDH